MKKFVIWSYSKYSGSKAIQVVLLSNALRKLWENNKFDQGSKNLDEKKGRNDHTHTCVKKLKPITAACDHVFWTQMVSRNLSTATKKYERK